MEKIQEYLKRKMSEPVKSAVKPKPAYQTEEVDDYVNIKRVSDFAAKLFQKLVDKEVPAKSVDKVIKHVISNSETTKQAIDKLKKFGLDKLKELEPKKKKIITNEPIPIKTESAGISRASFILEDMPETTLVPMEEAEAKPIINTQYGSTILRADDLL